jgi:hypothetical protein
VFLIAKVTMDEINEVRRSIYLKNWHPPDPDVCESVGERLLWLQQLGLQFPPPPPSSRFGGLSDEDCGRLQFKRSAQQSIEIIQVEERDMRTYGIHGWEDDPFDGTGIQKQTQIDQIEGDLEPIIRTLPTDALLRATFNVTRPSVGDTFPRSHEDVD